MSKTLLEQSEETLRIASDALKEFNADPLGYQAVEEIIDAHRAAWTVHEKWLTAEEQRLTEELRRTVLALSARIRAIRLLRRHTYYGMGMQDGFKDSISNERSGKNGKTAVSN